MPQASARVAIAHGAALMWTRCDSNPYKRSIDYPKRLDPTGRGLQIIAGASWPIGSRERPSGERAAEHYAAIIESSDDAILSKDLNGTIMTWNRGAELLFGYTAEEVVGKPVTILIPMDRQDEEPFILERVR